MKNLYLNLTTLLNGKSDTQYTPATRQYFFRYER
jgi:hypothetical protein